MFENDANRSEFHAGNEEQIKCSECQLHTYASFMCLWCYFTLTSDSLVKWAPKNDMHSLEIILVRYFSVLFLVVLRCTADFLTFFSKTKVLMILGKTKMMVESQKHRLLKWTKKVTAFVRKLTCGRMIRAASTRVLTRTQVNFTLHAEAVWCDAVCTSGMSITSL